MSNLTIAEKKKLEKLLGMSGGYVLNYSNRTFAEFVLESTGIDIDDERYCSNGNSKANRLRMFWKLEDNQTVGKLLNDLINDIDQPYVDIEICRLIVNRLLGQTPSAPIQSPAPADQHRPVRPDISRSLAELKDEFLKLIEEKDRNKAGLQFESFLNRLFALFDLKPKRPFKIAGEQIDGSFDLDHEIYLLELKWENHPLPQAPLLVFREKIEGKSAFTRGVFVAVNGITSEAHDAITRGKQPLFFVVDGHDLLMILSEAMSLPEFLRRRVRLLLEEGRVCVPFSELMEDD
jgi:hypothetical protein